MSDFIDYSGLDDQALIQFSRSTTFRSPESTIRPLQGLGVRSFHENVRGFRRGRGDHGGGLPASLGKCRELSAGARQTQHLDHPHHPNQAIDQLRKRERSGNPVRLQWEDTNPPVLEGNTPETATELSLLRQRVRTALNTLSVEQREPLLLAYFKGLSHRRIAEELKLPLGTVKTRISLGMRKLA